MSSAVETTVLVNAREAAAIARVNVNRWWGIAKASPVLRRARRRRSNRTFWLTKVVIKWVEEGGTL